MDRIPILKMGDALLITIQVDMHDRLAIALEDDLTQKIVQTRAKGVLIDISSLEIVDSFIGRMLDNIAAVSRILDAETVVVGMRPAVAITLVELGLTLGGVKTAAGFYDYAGGKDAEKIKYRDRMFTKISKCLFNY